MAALSYQARPPEAGSSAGEPFALCQAEAVDCREIGAPASATELRRHLPRAKAKAVFAGVANPLPGTGEESPGTHSHVGAIL